MAVEPPSGRNQDIAYAVIKRLFKPEFINPDNIPADPCLFVGNHSLFALDGLVMGPALLQEHGRFLRGLGDKFLWNAATAKTVLAAGGVLGHPEVCSALMDHGSDLLVFPGGAHEATKTEAQKYTLQWKQRFGFVKLAAKHGYTIMPTAIVGPDEFYSHWMEGEDLPNTALGRWLTSQGILTEDTRPDMLPPIPRGTMGSLFPRPQRCYTQFGEPVDLSKYKGKTLTKKQLNNIRGEVAEQIEDMLQQLLFIASSAEAKIVYYAGYSRCKRVFTAAICAVFRPRPATACPGPTPQDQARQ